MNEATTEATTDQELIQNWLKNNKVTKGLPAIAEGAKMTYLARQVIKKKIYRERAIRKLATT